MSLGLPPYIALLSSQGREALPLSWLMKPPFLINTSLKQTGGGGMGKLGDLRVVRAGVKCPDSELRSLPADLPRNLASFSPSVDDRDSGGAWPRHLWHRGLLPHRRGRVRVLSVGFNSRGQWGNRSTVLEGERGAVHRLALGRTPALWSRDRVGAGEAAAKTGAQL